MDARYVRCPVCDLHNQRLGERCVRCGALLAEAPEEREGSAPVEETPDEQKDAAPVTHEGEPPERRQPAKRRAEYRFGRCPNCRQFTALPAERCAHCGASLPDVPAAQRADLVPLPEPPPPVVLVLGALTPVKAYLGGLAVGIVPLVAAALIAGGFAVFFTGWALVLACTLGAIICLKKRRWRWLGYGLVTVACISPVVAFIGCLAGYSQVTL